MNGVRDTTAEPALGARRAALAELLCERRSVRRFRAEAVPEALIEELLSAAVAAPSASNKQPWRFVVVTRRSAIDEMAAAVREAVAEIRAHIPAASADAFASYGEYFTRFEHAPVVIAPTYRGHTLLSNLVDQALAPDARARIDAMERDSALTGVSLAMMNLLLAAHAAGLGASLMTGPLLAVDRLRGILSVPASWGIAALVAAGYPDEDPPATARKGVDKVTRWLR